jgi:outer membrane protein assembly factor BamB
LRAIASLVVCGLGLCFLRPALAQLRVVRVVNGAAVLNISEDVDASQRMFLLPGGGSEFKEALQDFHRYVERAAWEKAFKSLETVRNTKVQGLVSGDQGLQIPLTTLIQQMLADLPAAGKAAYRLFNDAEAKKLLDDAKGEDEIEKLSRLASEFLITNAGDVAADRLGDIYFELGDYRRAADAWQSVVRYRTDSKITPGYLLTKSAVALARAGDSAEFANLRQYLLERYGNDEIVLGGQKTTAKEYLARITPEVTESPGPSPLEFPDVVLPKEPSDSTAQRAYWAEQPDFWQFRVNRSSGLTMHSPNGQMWINGQMIESRLDCMMSLAMDGERVYGNLLGWTIALDLATGKLAWQKGRIFELQKQIQNQNLYIDPECYTIAEDHGVVWTTAIPLDQFNRSDMQTYLFACDAKTGKEIVNSQKGTPNADLKKWNFLGRPLLTANNVFALAVQGAQGRDLTVLNIDPKDGKVRWSTVVGAYKQTPMRNYRYGNANSIPLPQVTLNQGRLYVETGLGTMARVVPQTGKLEWGMLYDCGATDANDNDWSNRFTKHPVGMSEPLFSGGQMFFKGARSTRLYCLDPRGPEVLWKRPVSVSAKLLSVDSDSAYVLDEMIDKIDLKTQKIVAPSQLLPKGNYLVQPLVTENFIYVFTPRGIYQFQKSDLTRTQTIFRGADTDSLGGILLATPKSLLAVSNLGISCYPIVPATHGQDKPK